MSPAVKLGFSVNVLPPFRLIVSPWTATDWACPIVRNGCEIVPGLVSLPAGLFDT